MNTEKKKIAVIGIGGVGGYIAGLLAKAYPHVTMVARGARAESIRKKGLVLHSDYKGEIVAKPERVVPIQDMGQQDYIFICVKNYSLAEVCESIRDMVTDDTVIIPVMNGVDPGENIRRLVGKGTVVDSLIYTVAFANEDFSISQQDTFTWLCIGIKDAGAGQSEGASQEKPQYGHYEVHQPQAGNYAGGNIPPKKPRKKRDFSGNNSFGKKAPTAVALAVIFGLVAGVVFQGVNIAADKYRGNDSSTTIGKTETVTGTEDSTDSSSADSAVKDIVAESGTVAGKKCIILEHCVHIALIRFQGCHILSIQKNLAGIWLFQACNDPQCGGFSTAGRPQQSDKFSFFCCKTNAFQDVLTFLEALFYVFQF